MTDDEPAREKSNLAGESVSNTGASSLVPSSLTAQTPADFLAYAKPATELLPDSDHRSKVSPFVGTLALWIAYIAAFASVSAAATVIWEQTLSGYGVINDVQGLLVLIALVSILLAIALGTIGRLNYKGRKAATLGRGIGCAIPVVFLFVSLIPVAFGPRGDPAGAFVGFLFTFMAGVIFLTVADIILGAD